MGKNFFNQKISRAGKVIHLRLLSSHAKEGTTFQSDNGQGGRNKGECVVVRSSRRRRCCRRHHFCPGHHGPSFFFTGKVVSLFLQQKIHIPTGEIAEGRLLDAIETLFSFSNRSFHVTLCV